MRPSEFEGWAAELIRLRAEGKEFSLLARRTFPLPPFILGMMMTTASSSSSWLPPRVTLPVAAALSLMMMVMVTMISVPTVDAMAEASGVSSTVSAKGLTDDSPLATRKGVPDASLCEHGDAGHRRATTMGDDFLKQGNYLRAEACYLGALRYKSDFPMALYGLGEVHAKEKRDGLAREAYNLAIGVWPQYVDAHIALGDLHHKFHRNSKAEASYNKAVAAAPTDPMAWEALGKHQLLLNKPDRALNTYKRAILKVPNGENSPGLVLGLARVAKAREKWEECIEHGQKAASMAPGFGMARHAVGQCKIETSDVSGGIADMREAARLEPDVKEHHTDLAAALAHDGQFDAADRALEEGLKALPGDNWITAAQTTVRSFRARSMNADGNKRRETGNGGAGGRGDSESDNGKKGRGDDEEEEKIKEIKKKTDGKKKKKKKGGKEEEL